MSRLTDLIAQTKARDPQLGADVDHEFRQLSSRLPFGLKFERRRPEAVELPQRPIRKGDKVRVLPPLGSTKNGELRLWRIHEQPRRLQRTGNPAPMAGIVCGRSGVHALHPSNRPRYQDRRHDDYADPLALRNQRSSSNCLMACKIAFASAGFVNSVTSASSPLRSAGNSRRNSSTS